MPPRASCLLYTSPQAGEATDNGVFRGTQAHFLPYLPRARPFTAFIFNDASLLLGVHQGNSRVVRNNRFDHPIEDSHTLGTVMRDAGYDTAAIGK